MKIQLRAVLAAALTLSCALAAAQAAPPESRQDAAQQEVLKKAEALTQEQISQSRDIGSLTKLSELYHGAGDEQRFGWTLKRLTQLLPDSGTLRLQLAMFYAQQKDLPNAYDTLVHMQGQGFGYDIAKDDRFANIHGTKVWDYIVANLQANAKQFGEGKVAFSLPKGDYLFESIAWDPQRKQFLVGSAREGKVYLATKDGKISEFVAAGPDNGMWGVLDLAVDAAHDKLYVASTDIGSYKHFDADAFGKAGVFEFQLSTGKFEHKYLLDDPGTQHILTSIVVAKDGHVYAADGIRRQIFHLDGGALKMLVENPKLTGIRALAVSDDGKQLYIADYALGIFGIDLATMKPFALAHDPEKLVLGGIDGMFWYDGCLVVVESGMVPQRVMRLKLGPDARSIVAAMPLDVAQPAFALPTNGTVAGDELYFIANSQKGLYDQYGVLKHPEQLEATRVFKSNLRFAWDQSGISTSVSELPKKPGEALQVPMKAPEPKDGDKH